MPSGGVDVDNVDKWIKAGAYAVGTGSSLTKGVGRNRCHELRVMAVVGQRYGYIGLAAAVIDVKLVSLDEFA